jgi:RNA polymerase sigma-70 factor, ECF subfamily
MPNHGYAIEDLYSVKYAQECELIQPFLNQPDAEAFDTLFRIFSPRLVLFFCRRGHEKGAAEDLAQEVMLSVYREIGQLRDHNLFHAWLFKIARHAEYRFLAQRARQVPIVDLAAVPELPAPSLSPFGPTVEFGEWMRFLNPDERVIMTLRFVEDWEYHEIATAKAIPIGTVQWRVFNSKKKLAVHLSPVRDLEGKAA